MDEVQKPIDCDHRQNPLELWLLKNVEAPGKGDKAAEFWCPTLCTILIHRLCYLHETYCLHVNLIRWASHSYRKVSHRVYLLLRYWGCLSVSTSKSCCVSAWPAGLTIVATIVNNAPLQTVHTYITSNASIQLVDGTIRLMVLKLKKCFRKYSICSARCLSMEREVIYVLCLSDTFRWPSDDRWKKMEACSECCISMFCVQQ
jgi:hypothetical protein